MSSKINVFEIVMGHVKTLQDPSGKALISDYFTFFAVPALVAFLGVYLKFTLNKDVSSLLVNFGSIFTALLLSVLVLVYDQESKIDGGKEKDPLYTPKKKLLSQLYYNISYSVVCSILLVVFCLLNSIIYGDANSDSSKIENIWFGLFALTPITVFITSNLVLTIIMIVKRMHTLLTIR